MSTIQTIAPMQAQNLVRSLTALGDQLEAADNPAWLVIAQAAMTLEGLRLGFVEFAPRAGVNHG